MTETLLRPREWSPGTAGGRSRRRTRRRLVLTALGMSLVALLAGGAVLARHGSDPAAGLVTGEAPDGGVGNTENLQPAVRSAIERAIAAAAADGVELRVTSGWRSAEHQQELYAAAIKKYGSPSKARHWVLPPAESEHVKGGAVDVGPASGATWLERHGVAYGLCRRYDNEPWHFERLAGAKGSVCPPREPFA